MKKKLSGLLGILGAATAAVLLSRGGHRPTPKPVPPPVVEPARTGYLAVWLTDAQGRPVADAHLTVSPSISLPDRTNADGWSGAAAAFGDYRVSIEAAGFVPIETSIAVNSDRENTDLRIALAREVAPVLPVRVDGRFFVTDAGTFRPVFQSGLTLLVRSPAERAAFLDETRALGFNGVRVFAGALPWANQTPEGARAVLPALLEEAASRGLYVYVSAITESKTGYDVEAHLRAVAAICAAHVGCLLEVANEIGHPTQSDDVNDQSRLLALARRAIPGGLPWALGAPLGQDEPDELGRYRGDGGPFNTAHLDRGRDTWNQVRRLREIEAVSAATRKPTFSGEPIGADERMGGATGTKQRRNDPAFFFALGALSRGFELATVFHSEAGLQGQLLGPVQRQCAEAFLAGWRSMDTAERLQFVNAKWAGSPVEDADFARVVRAYSFVSGNRGWTVLVGLSGDPAIRWGGGWAPRGVVAEQAGVQVVEIGR